MTSASSYIFKIDSSEDAQEEDDDDDDNEDERVLLKLIAIKYSNFYLFITIIIHKTEERMQ